MPRRRRGLPGPVGSQSKSEDSNRSCSFGRLLQRPSTASKELPQAACAAQFSRSVDHREGRDGYEAFMVESLPFLLSRYAQNASGTKVCASTSSVWRSVHPRANFRSNSTATSGDTRRSFDSRVLQTPRWMRCSCCCPHRRCQSQPPLLSSLLLSSCPNSFPSPPVISDAAIAVVSAAAALVSLAWASISLTPLCAALPLPSTGRATYDCSLIRPQPPWPA